MEPSPVRILFFSTLARLTGKEETTWRPPQTAATARDAWRAQCTQFPALIDAEASLLVAINQTFAKLDTPLPQGAVEIAFMPPVQGG